MPNISKTNALKVSLLAIISVVFVEGFAGILTGSLALVSDSTHAAFDALSTFILLAATSLSLRPADEDHTYGHGKIESIGALIGGVVLFVLSATIVILAAFRLSTGSSIRPSFLGYAAATYTIAIDFLRMGVLTLAVRSGRSLTVKADLYHAISDFASTSLVIVALVLASIGYPVADTAVSLTLAALLGYLSVRLVYFSSMDLSDAVSRKLVASILREISETDDVLTCKELRVRHVGPTTYVDTVVTVSSKTHLVDAHTVSSRIEAKLTKLLGRSSIMVHVEPLEWEVPIERKIQNVAGSLSGVKDVHNLTVATVDDGLYVTLHAQVNPSLPLERAHAIADSVERKVKSSVHAVRHVTVHLEPWLPERTSASKVEDKYIEDSVRAIVQGFPRVVEISKIIAYSSGERLHINIHCLFEGETSIHEVHRIVSDIEERVRGKFSNAIVTIHPEPVSTESPRTK